MSVGIIAGAGRSGGRASLAEAALDVKKATVLRSSAALARTLRQSSRLPEEELRSHRDAASLAAARFAMTHTRFYRERYTAAGLTVDDLDDPAVFARLPMVTKDDVRENFAGITSTEAGRRTATLSVTGGSTGEPLRLLRDLRFPARALEWRLMEWWGVSPADSLAVVTRHTKSTAQARWHAVQWWPTRRLQLDAFAMDRDAVTKFLGEWEWYRPQLVIGYVGAIAELAAMIADGVAAPPLPPRAIAVTAAPLSSTQRQLIESVFRAPVYDHYRSAEVPWMAGECAERNGLHVFADVRTVEIVDETGQPCPPGVTGEVVVSDLTNRVFPLLRYRIGDRAAYLGRDCPCGVTLPLLSPIAGRTTEVMHLPNGQAVAGEGLAQLFSFAPTAVRQFQIHQRADYSIDLRVVRGSDPDAAARIAEAADRFRTMVRGSVPVRVREVESIAHDGGKVRYLSSDLSR